MRRLSTIGNDQDQILDSLALIVIDPDQRWRKRVRRNRAQLKNLANNLNSVANHAERITSDITCRGQFWVSVLSGAKYDPKDPTADRTKKLIHEMRKYAEYNRKKAEKFGSLLLRRQAAQQQRYSRQLLIVKVWALTGRYHDDIVARLLTDAYEAVGKPRHFSADQIKKFRQRYVGHSTISWSQFQGRKRPQREQVHKKGDNSTPSN